MKFKVRYRLMHTLIIADYECVIDTDTEQSAHAIVRTNKGWPSARLVRTHDNDPGHDFVTTLEATVVKKRPQTTPVQREMLNEILKCGDPGSLYSTASSARYTKTLSSLEKRGLVVRIEGVGPKNPYALTTDGVAALTGMSAP